MNERDWADRFNTDVDTLLESRYIAPDAESGDYQEMLALAQMLAADDTRSKSGAEQALRQRLIGRVTEMNKRHHPDTKGSTMDIPVTRHLRLRRLALGALALIACLTMSTLTLPPIRAVAQDLIYRIGNFVITNKPSDAEQYVATLQSGIPTPTVDPNWVCTDCPEPEVVGLLTVAQASEKADFPVYDPAYIPPGYRLQTRDVLFTTDTTTVSTDYYTELEPPLHEGEQLRGIIAVGQTRVRSGAQPWETGIGDVPVVEVTVRNQQGVWLEQIPIYPFQNRQGEWDYARWNQLIWAEAGYNFMVQTNMPADLLPLDELLRVAESLTP